MQFRRSPSCTNPLASLVYGIRDLSVRSVAFMKKRSSRVKGVLILNC